jgi:hypothetical protein
MNNYRFGHVGHVLGFDYDAAVVASNYEKMFIEGTRVMEYQ